MKYTLIALALSTLAGCAVMQSAGNLETAPEVTKTSLQKEFDSIPAPNSPKPLSVAVYSFQDKTGQRRPQQNIASLSTAVTQGAETFLIKALQDVGRGQWFEVVERVGVDNLTKERLIIRQMREAYEGNNAKPLMPMQFAGMIIEGGIIGYDSSTNSGGAGQRIFGIGKQTQWTQDVVTIGLRAVSVNTGKVLISVVVQKNILSTADSVTALKFFDMGTQAFEAEAGLTINEPGTYAVKTTIEAAVVEMIKEGQRRGVWDYKKEKTDELVQKETKTEGATTPAPTQNQPSNGKDAEGSTENRTREETSGTNGSVQVVTAVDPKVTAKNPTNPTAGARADATVLAELVPKVTAIPKPPEPPRPICKDMKEAAQGNCIVQPPEKVYLTADICLYKDITEKSQCTWLLKKGTELTTVPPNLFKEWVLVTTSDGKKGYVRENQLTTNRPEVKSKLEK